MVSGTMDKGQIAQVEQKSIGGTFRLSKSFSPTNAAEQGLTLVHVRAQLEHLQDMFMS